MPDIKLEIVAKDPNDKTVTTTVPNVNPEAVNADLLTFAQKLNSFTRNQYASSNKITEVNLDTTN